MGYLLRYSGRLEIQAHREDYTPTVAPAGRQFGRYPCRHRKRLDDTRSAAARTMRGGDAVDAAPAPPRLSHSALGNHHGNPSARCWTQNRFLGQHGPQGLRRCSSSGPSMVTSIVLPPRAPSPSMPIRSRASLDRSPTPYRHGTGKRSERRRDRGDRTACSPSGSAIACENWIIGPPHSSLRA